MPEKELAKLFYVTNVFVFEETGKETRERWQCGAELIGAGSTTADVELVILALEVLKRLGLEDVELRLSHAGLIKALLMKFGLSPGEQSKIFDQMLDGDAEVLAKLREQIPALDRTLAPLLELNGRSSGFLRNMKALSGTDLPELKPALDAFADITDLLEILGCRYQIDITSGRDFEYYTGVMFQLLIGGVPVGGGGRYDALIPLMGGRDVPASGLALYLDRLMNVIKTDTLASPSAQRVLIKAESTGAAVLKEVFRLANLLHETGYAAEVYLGGQKPADFRWSVAVQGQAPLFVLTDRAENKKVKAQSVDEVLALLKA